MVIIEQEVKFNEWCPKCKYADLTENDLPCGRCVEDAVNMYSSKPTQYEEAD